VTALNCSNISKSYGRLKVLNNVSLSINKGELVTLLGPSGCGKTTLLRSIAGLADIDEGSIVLEGRDVTRTPIHKRHIAMVFQSHALFPHMSVADNVAFGLKMQGVARAEREERVKKALSLVRLDAYVSRMPHELSGGQQQRVAIARAIVTNPTALLLDEPFGALDRKLREALQVELRRVTKELGITAIFVTHDQEEAVVLSDRVAVMEGGVIQQIAPANEVYENPANEFVASFMGFQNILDATIEGVADGQTGLRIGDTSPCRCTRAIGDWSYPLCHSRRAGRAQARAGGRGDRRHGQFADLSWRAERLCCRHFGGADCGPHLHLGRQLQARRRGFCDLRSLGHSTTEYLREKNNAYLIDPSPFPGNDRCCGPHHRLPRNRACAEQDHRDDAVRWRL